MLAMHSCVTHVCARLQVGNVLVCYTCARLNVYDVLVCNRYALNMSLTEILLVELSLNWILKQIVSSCKL